MRLASACAHRAATRTFGARVGDTGYTVQNSKTHSAHKAPRIAKKRLLKDQSQAWPLLFREAARCRTERKPSSSTRAVCWPPQKPEARTPLAKTLALALFEVSVSGGSLARRPIVIWDDIIEFVGSDAGDTALDLIPDHQSKSRRRQSPLSTAFWVMLVIAMVTVFWLVFTG